jgi:hypothetical protein
MLNNAASACSFEFFPLISCLSIEDTTAAEKRETKESGKREAKNQE